MADPNDKSHSTLDKPLVAPWDKHITTPDSVDGMGSTLGEDVSPEHQRVEDARNGAHDQGGVEGVLDNDDLDR